MIVPPVKPATTDNAEPSQSPFTVVMTQTNARVVRSVKVVMASAKPVQNKSNARWIVTVPKDKLVVQDNALSALLPSFAVTKQVAPQVELVPTKMVPKASVQAPNAKVIAIVEK